MGIPILDEVFAGIRWVIDFFVEKFPKPLKIILFLLLLLFFGSMISVVLQVIGFHCTTSKEMVKVDFLDVVTNLRVLKASFGEVINENSYTIEEVHKYNNLIGVDCYYLLEDVGGGEYEFCVNESDPNCRYHWRDPECYNCSSTINAGWVFTFYGLIPTRHIGTICDSDAYPKKWSTIERYFSCEALCEIPEYFRFEQDNGSYVCDNPTYCGDNRTVDIDKRVDNILQNADAELLYKDKSSKDYKHTILLKCNNNYAPRLTFFGIDLFDYRLWLIIIVISTLLIFLHKFIIK